MVAAGRRADRRARGLATGALDRVLARRLDAHHRRRRGADDLGWRGAGGRPRGVRAHVPARFAPRPATPLLAAVESIPRLAHADLDAWPGPEDADVSALNRYEVELAAPVERAIRGLHRDDVRAHAEEIGARVRASTNVPYDPDGAPWHPPTAAVELAVAETLVGYVGLGWPVPDDLRTLWAWYEAGRWPGAVSDGALVVY